MDRQAISIEQIISDSNLLQAWYKVRANNGCAGIDRETIPDFERRLMANLALLRDEVIYQTYRPRPLFRIHVPKKNGNGLRSLSIPTVRDRVLHTAVAIALTPLFEAEFEECSYAYRKGRSVDMAVRRVAGLRDRGFTWVVDADIHSFFDEIDHGQLLNMVRNLVTDAEIVALISLWLRADVVDMTENYRYQLQKGVPQGSPLSPLLANLYLDQLDEAMLENDLRLVRFADDFLILCRHKSGADKALRFTAEVLESLSLEINREKTRVVDFRQGFRFLGVEFVRSLILKTKYPEVAPITVDVNSLADLPGTHPSPDPVLQQNAISEEIEKSNQKHISSRSEMAMAFAEAGIQAADFPEQRTVEQVIPLEPPIKDKNRQQLTKDPDPRLRTLYVLEHGYVLGKESERFVIKKKGRIIQRIPAIKVDQIMVFGNAQLTTQVMQFCLQTKIPIYLLSGSGRFYGVVDGFNTDPVYLHRDQFRRAEDPRFCLSLARQVIRGKIANSRVVLLRYKRNRGLLTLGLAADKLKGILQRLKSAASLDAVRGYEGSAARIYFEALASTIDSDFLFTGRTRQPPKDPLNALLSYGYTLLYYNLYSFLRARGLNPHIGFLHPIRMGHPALVSDMIEEFRAIVVDTVALNLVYNRRVLPEQFSLPSSPNEGCLMGKQVRALFIRELEKKLNASIVHPVSGLHLDYRRCLEHQINYLASVIQGREETYSPMVLR